MSLNSPDEVAVLEAYVRNVRATVYLGKKLGDSYVSQMSFSYPKSETFLPFELLERFVGMKPIQTKQVPAETWFSFEEDRTFTGSFRFDDSNWFIDIFQIERFVSSDHEFRALPFFQGDNWKIEVTARLAETIRDVHAIEHVPAPSFPLSNLERHLTLIGENANVLGNRLNDQWIAFGFNDFNCIATMVAESQKDFSFDMCMCSTDPVNTLWFVLERSTGRVFEVKNTAQLSGI